MKILLTYAAVAVMLAFSAPIYAGDKACSGMNDGSFACAGWLAAETFYDLLDTDLPQQMAIDACLEVLTDQLGKGVGGNQQFVRGDVALTISATTNVLACTAK